jgi:hypothetical protein
MESKIKDAIEFYNNKLNRKNRILFSLTDKIANGKDLTIKESEDKNILIAEISLIKRFIEELEDLL